MSPKTRKMLLIISDSIIVNSAVLLAILVRFEGSLPAEQLNAYRIMAPWFTLLSLACFYYSRLYSSIWAYASIDEVFSVIQGVSLSIAGFALIAFTMRFYGIVHGFSRSVIVLTWLTMVILVGGVRLSARAFRRFGKPGWANRNSVSRVLLVGAGDAGSMVLKELRTHPDMGVQVVGFIDDDPRKQGLRAHGVKVLGTRRELARVASEYGVDEVIVTMPSAPQTIIRDVVNICHELKIKIKTIPGVYEVLSGSVSLSQIRPVEIEDLLGRQEVEIDLEEIASYLKGERVLITGAAGSIGSELCRQVCRFWPKMLILLDNNETGIFDIHYELTRKGRALNVLPIVGDVRDNERLREIFRQYSPSVVFHAAAYKHVPLMEANPAEAVKTNVLGTKNVAEASAKFGVRKFVLISTDKAVNPTNVMGASKRIAEMIVQTIHKEQQKQFDLVAFTASEIEGFSNPETGMTKFTTVRFGNVIGSRGSVIPMFKRQIEEGGPVTVTHPDMTRYFMTIPEAVRLVIQAGAMGQGGDIFVLDMGEPIKIADLAATLIKLSGFVPGQDIEIRYTQPRPGEKLVEEMLTQEEGVTATKHQKIFVCKNGDGVKLDGELLNNLVDNCVNTEGDNILGTMKKIVPEFHHE